MKFKVGHPKVGGRKRGIRPHKSELFAEILEENNFCPATAMIKLFAKASKHASDTKKTPTARALFMKIAADMAKELASYSYPQLRALEIEREDPLAGMSVQEKLQAMKDAVKLLEAQERADGSGPSQSSH